LHLQQTRHMGIQVAIKHITTYTYDRAIKLWPQTLRLKPAPHSRTKILSYALDISPQPHFINWLQDPFGNYQARIVFPEKVKEFAFSVEVIADLVAINPFDFFLDESAQTYPFTYSEHQLKELQPYLEITESGTLLMKLLDECQGYIGKGTVDFLVDLNRHINDKIDYTIRLETGVQDCEVTLEKHLGSCRDSAWLLVQLLRHFGLAARFVSGYLVQLKADQKSQKGPSGPQEDFTDLHAWAEVFIPGAGWIGLDATSGLFASEGHIPLACTPHYSSAAPISGATEKTKVIFGFDNQVERLHEQPRVSKPYTSRQIKDIQRLGAEVDDILDSSDAKLTMGGEPTFISKDDMESSQWNTEADGKEKRELAYDLAMKLRSHYGPQGVMHFGQGKWYPGEPIPRWQYAMYWKSDGQPIWQDVSLIGNPNKAGKTTLAQGHTFLKQLASNLGLDPKYVMPAHEDKYYYLWEEHNLPKGFEQTDDKQESIARQTLLQLLKEGLDQEVGYVLPLKYNIDHQSWDTNSWEFDRAQLFLIPGNSQIGLRLPLDSIQVEEEVGDIVIPADHFEPSEGLWTISLIDQRIHERRLINRGAQTNKCKTALCAQVVDGNLYVFLPPTNDINHFLDLIHTIEVTAQDISIPVIIEGYQPPYDVLFSCAEEVGLGTNKFMIDGKHTGTGGGNHITLGGVSPADSPFLRRPDVLRSMVNFWQNHPGLSYLFSSTFIGPTSQAPRIDEGRPDIIYEMEIAFKELEKQTNPPFWMVDRIMRNLLTDITGNTHRAEFCIDKLYSPDSSSGRLGILELRGFDMPPHKEMCLVQLLLIRALFASFWRQPYKNKLIHWGTELHNKFMMYHFVKKDMHEVIDYLNNNGIAFQKEWLEVFFNFRFPEYGSVHVKGINITLRAALEPWIVLGEEMTQSGTSRYVDSSVERLEVLVEDFNPERYLLLCNSVQVPLVKTDYSRKYVASIRYKAWAPYSALHPTIGVDTPLTFDIYDTWNERSIGGCTYHVVHPGGRNYATFPVNSLEAESRRTTRFAEYNHSPKTATTISNQSGSGPTTSYVVPNLTEREILEVKQIPISRDFPHTLDLRRK